MGKIYVASSWRNFRQPGVVVRLREEGHQVYDFRDPNGDGKDTGFHWSEIDKDWEDWTVEQYRDALRHPIAEAGFQKDIEGLHWCETLLLLLPSGTSSHAEFGWAVGSGKRTIVLLADGEPELMRKMADDICLNLNEVVVVLRNAES